MRNKIIGGIMFSLAIFTGTGQTVRTISSGTPTDGLALDIKGNVYASEWGGNQVFKYDSNGTMSLFASGFVSPNGIATDDSAQVYICDHYADSIFKFDEWGTKLRAYGGFQSPSGIRKLPDSPDFVVVEYGGNRIKRLSPGGTIRILYSGKPLKGPAGIGIVDTAIYVANYDDRRIYQLLNDSLHLIAIIPGLAGAQNAVGFMTEYADNLYATHIGSHKIYKVDLANNSVSLFAGSVAGGQDGALQNATFNGPNGIAADTVNQRLYITDIRSRNLRVIENFSIGMNSFDPRIDVETFPNPSIDHLRIHLPGTVGVNKGKITIARIDGTVVLEDQFENQEFTINLEPYSMVPGQYVLTLHNDNFAYTKLIMKH